MDHSNQAACAGHVHPVVILRAQVNGGEIPAVKIFSQRSYPPHQRRRGVIVPFSLEYPVSGNNPELAYGSIGRADIIGLRDRTRFCKQGTGKEIIERPITSNVRIYRFIHIDAVMPDKPVE